MPAFREDRILVIAIGSCCTRISFGLAESLLPPQHVIDTKVGQLNGDYTLENGDIYPLEAGRIVNMEAFLGFLQLIIKKYNQLPTCPVLLACDNEWNSSDRESISKCLFESCDVSAMMYCDENLAGLLAFNTTEGLVVNVGHERVILSAFIDSKLDSRVSLPVGSKAITAHLERIFDLSPDAANNLKESGLLSLPVYTKEEEKTDEEFDVAAIVVHGKKNEEPAETEEPESRFFEHDGKKIEVTASNSKITQVLFEEIVDHVDLLLSKVDADRREHVKENLVVIGGGARIHGWKEYLLELISAKYASSSAAIPMSAMPSNLPTPTGTGTSTPVPSGPVAHNGTIRLLKIPDYFIEWKTTDSVEAAFLGLQICARIIYVTDAGNRAFMTKDEYAEEGSKAARRLV